jgi:Cysteine rich repeat
LKNSIHKEEIIMKIGRAVISFLFIIAVMLCLPFFGGMSASAQGTGACAGDVQTFCSGVEPGQGRILQCLKQNKESLSPGCKVRILEVATQLDEVSQACQDDILWSCPGIQPGGGRIAKCLQANQAQLSPECKSTIAEERGY